MTRSGGIAPPKSRAPLVIGMTATTAVVILAALYFLLFQNPNDSNTMPQSIPIAPVAVATTPTPGPESAATAPLEIKEAAAEVQIRLQAKPSTARIAIDGVIGLGNPYESTVLKDDAVHKVEISAEGYAPLTAEIHFDRDQALAYTLSKETKEKTAHKRHSQKADAKAKAKDNGTTAKTEKSASTPAKSETPKSSRRRIDDEDPWK
jgi:hypothetical protein